MGKEGKNMIFAVVISLVILMGWETFVLNPKKEEISAYNAKLKKLEKDNIESLTITQRINHARNMAVIGSESGEIPTLKNRKEILENTSNDSRIKISTDKLHGSMTLKGMRIDDLTLAGYRQELDKNSPEVPLFSPKGTKDVYFAEFGWLSVDDNIATPDKNTIWSADKDELIAGEPTIFTWDNNQGIIFKNTVTLDENYMFDIKQEIINNSGKSATFLPYALLNQARANSDSAYFSHEGPLGVMDGVLEEILYEDIQDDKSKKYESVHGWAGIGSKYWLSALIPGGIEDKNTSVDIQISYSYKNKLHRYQVDLLGEALTVESGESDSISQHLYAGAKILNLLDKYGEELKIPNFDRAIDFGILYFIAQPMFSLLTEFNSITGNFGIAILILTLIIKLLLFPLANKSYKSMAKMKKVMPEIEILKKRYKDDRAKLGQETMKFYREKKISPMAGCLPLLAQMPIFFALYRVLYVTIEMRHAPFYGWIHDLSAPDPTTLFNVFGLIQWDIPGFVPAIGVLPLLFMFSMMIQQKLNPPPQDPTQAMVMKWMPVVFVFLFAGFPAGLVIYWVFSNILSILQQWVITRKINKEE